MSELALNGNQSTNQHVPDEAYDKERDLEPHSAKNEITDTELVSPLGIDGDSNHEEPPLKRRKVTDARSNKPSPRAFSPPWKKAVADGPTTFLENGRRRSGRTNVVPLDQQLHSGKRQTRAAYDKMVERQGKPQYNVRKQGKPIENAMQVSMAATTTATADTTIKTPPRRRPGRPPKVKVEGDMKLTPVHLSSASNRGTDARSAQPQSPSLRRNMSLRPLTAKKESAEGKTRSPSPPLTLQKVKFRVALPQPSILTPANAPPPKIYANFREFLEKDPLEPFAGQDALSIDQIRKEAVARQRLYEAQRSGQLASENNENILHEKRFEPRKHFAHHDHLLGHVLYFRKLLWEERKDHRKKAEQIAHEAKKYLEEKRKRGQVKTAEELAQEHMEKMRIRYRYVVKDLDRMWFAVQAEVNAIRQRKFEEEQHAKIKSHLNRVLERTDEMLTRREDSEITSELGSGSSSSSEDDSGTSDSEVMSTSSSDHDSAGEHGDPDEGLSAEQLRAKYVNLPNLDRGKDDRGSDADKTTTESVEEDSDPDVEMDSEFESDENEDSDADEEDDDARGHGLLSLFFSEKEMAAMSPETVMDPDSNSNEITSDFDDTDATKEVNTVPSISFNKPGLLKGGISVIQATVSDGEVARTNTSMIENFSQELDMKGQHKYPSRIMTSQPLHDGNTDDIASQDISVRTSPDTSATKLSEPDSVSSPEPQPETKPHHVVSDEKSSIKIPVSPLLRGTLREYQHEGLGWLANLYANGRSGILADEMGLGKTIQSIALLAHLATEYEVWGPHLIVVPTSVMLNWEMEFKKFLPGFKILTYYGTLEERKQKRRGWLADDNFNVCITSYQLVLQDANSFKRRRWHYMILDEAHNIKNFRSERWQTMMTFNTRARLLLTGTPLQNNLTELWSLLFFLHYGQEGEDEDEAFAGLKEWSEWFKRPVESILEHGRQVLDQEDKEQVAKLHKVIRPFLLRRLKADVEKQMPAKYEHVEMCRLSKRQRQLYDGFMARAQTRETLASGNYLSIINALMQLRKVCNHPDLFETRPINTSFAMSKSIAAQYEIQDLLLRRQAFGSSPLDEIDLDFLQLVPISNEKISLIENLETVRRHAYHPFKALRDSQWSRVNRHAVPAGQRRADILSSLENIGRKARLQDIDRTMYYEAYRHHQRPIYGRGLLEKLRLNTSYSRLSRYSAQGAKTEAWEFTLPNASLELVKSVDYRSKQMEPLIEHYACVTPAVVANDFSATLVTELRANVIRQEIGLRSDPFHQTRMKLSIAFPDKRLLQYDCGKLQRLDKLLKQLQAGGHRTLIFTQMTKVLDILEQFLNIHGHRYLRLDGATKIEQRQILTDRFNNDPRILCFILSSRSGGLGINLTGADTVIFYDLDWNPAMDRQCTDRAHRIGQTRDVHIYRFVSEHTIESNILRKANQKQLLDDVVIQDGDFTTDYVNRLNYRDMLDDQAEDDVAGAAMDRVLGNDKGAVTAFEQAEDREDVSAAKIAVKEVQHADDGDFEDKVTAMPLSVEPGTPGPFGATNAAIAELDQEEVRHIDDYMLKLQMFLSKDIPFALPREKGKRGRKRGV